MCIISIIRHRCKCCIDIQRSFIIRCLCMFFLRFFRFCLFHRCHDTVKRYFVIFYAFNRKCMLLRFIKSIHFQKALSCKCTIFGIYFFPLSAVYLVLEFSNCITFGSKKLKSCSLEFTSNRCILCLICIYIYFIFSKPRICISFIICCTIPTFPFTSKGHF